MLIEKEHFGRYSLRDADRKYIGGVMKYGEGWRFADARGTGPQQPRSSPTAALDLATTLSFLQPPAVAWSQLVSAADAKYGHNCKVARQ